MTKARTVALGRFLGIDVRLDWTSIAVCVVVALQLGAVVLPMWHADWSFLLTWAVALSATGLFLFSILAHELAHAVTAKRCGIRVDAVTLYVFGGVAHLEHDPRTPKHEALVAAAGPFVSLALGAGYLGLAMLVAEPPAVMPSDPTELFAGMGPGVTLLIWLGPANLAVGAFNLIPGLPLDGGRVLRAAIWQLSGDAALATRWTSYTGQAFAVWLGVTGAAMVLGIDVWLLGSGVASGLWLLFIGWYLSSTAAASYRRVAERLMLEGEPASKLMSGELPPTVSSKQLLTDFSHLAAARPYESVFLVSEGGILAGAVRSRDLRAVPRRSWGSTPVKAIMSSLGQLASAKPYDDAAAVAQRLGGSVHAVLVLDDEGELAGIIRPEDVAGWLERSSMRAPRLLDALANVADERATLMQRLRRELS